MKIVPCSVTLRKTDGSDLDVVNAARVSFHKESEYERNWEANKDNQSLYKLQERDVKLINYLAKHDHWTPFGHINATFVIKAPLFVARQLGKHQVGLVWNEVSRRYVQEEPEFFLPSSWRSAPVASIKQGSGSEVIDVAKFDLANGLQVEGVLELTIKLYNQLLGLGIAPEQARMVLPQNMMTEWWWTGSVAAFSRVCKLRLDPHTQQETRDIAAQMSDQLAEAFPVSWKALLEN